MTLACEQRLPLVATASLPSRRHVVAVMFPYAQTWRRASDALSYSSDPETELGSPRERMRAPNCAKPIATRRRMVNDGHETGANNRD